MLSLLLTLLPIWTSKEIFPTWAPLGDGYEYVLEISTDPEFNSIYLTTLPTTNSSTSAVISNTNKYYQRINYYIPNSNISGSIYLGQFYINLEHGYYGEDIVEFPNEEEIPKPTPIYEEEEPISNIPDQYILKSELDFRGDIPKQDIYESVLGIDTRVCNISLLRDGSIKVIDWDCDIDIQISNIKYLDWEEYISLEIQGVYPLTISSDIKVYECKGFSLFDPSTWFGCKKILTDTYIGDSKFIYSANTYLNNISQKNSSFAFMDTSFFVKNSFPKDISKESIYLKFNMYSQVKGKTWIDINYSIKKDIQLPKLEKAQSMKPFSFPLDRDIGVTQWHGCTVYQCPHKGIDFGARLNRVISIGDGKVVNVGYDKYGGECNQGGKFVIVKHTNGMYSAYIHLDSYSVKIGDSLKKGSFIGISGNTGRKNCQPLGYHLHFETRKALSSSTHVNPVNYLAIDWNAIPTIGYKQFPGRLGGDNPHPNF